MLCGGLQGGIKSKPVLPVLRYRSAGDNAVGAVKSLVPRWVYTEQEYKGRDSSRPRCSWNPSPLNRHRFPNPLTVGDSDLLLMPALKQPHGVHVRRKKMRKPAMPRNLRLWHGHRSPRGNRFLQVALDSSTSIRLPATPTLEPSPPARCRRQPLRRASHRSGRFHEGILELPAEQALPCPLHLNLTNSAGSHQIRACNACLVGVSYTVRFGRKALFQIALSQVNLST